MATYTDITETIRSFLVGAITELKDESAFVGNVDAAVDSLYENSTLSTSLVLDFLYAVPHPTDSGRRPVDIWNTYLGGMLIVKFTGREETEETKATVINLLLRAFDGGHTKVIQGTDKVMITRVERPEKATIGEHPFYFLPFTLKVHHGGR